MGTAIYSGGFLTPRAHHPDKEALYGVKANRRFSFSGLNGWVNQVCAALQPMGLVKGDRAALLACNRHEYLQCSRGSAKAGRNRKTRRMAAKTSINSRVPRRYRAPAVPMCACGAVVSLLTVFWIRQRG